MGKMVAYKSLDVLTATRKRLRFIFSQFDHVVISISGGKDSSVLYDLALREAAREGRRCQAFFLDQEAEYQSTIDIIAHQMAHASVTPAWYQVPIRMTNATSYATEFLYAWEPGAAWMREKHPLAIHGIEEEYPQRFYDFFPWYEAQQPKKTAFLIGLRSKESLNRFRSISNRAGYENIAWSTKTDSEAVYRFYPLYDWTFGDIWKYIVDNQLIYNAYYDRMFAKHGMNISRMRVSNLIHEKSFRALADLQEFEPATYDRLLRRLEGVHCAALYAHENGMYKASRLPANFTSWKAYRDYLLETTVSEKKSRFIARFDKQGDDERTCQMHCQQLLINDWENNAPIRKGMTAQVRQLWWGRL